MGYLDKGIRKETIEMGTASRTVGADPVELNPISFS